MVGARSSLASAALVALAVGGLLVPACTQSDEAILAALGGGCYLDSDCEGDLVCVFQRCHEACVTSADCPAEQRCVLGESPSHVCLLSDETECLRTSDCPPSLVCGTDRKCRDECIADADCPGDQVCSRQTCALESELVDGVLPVASPDDETPCTFDSECPAPQRCVEQICRLECMVDADCPSMSCTDNLCDPVGPTTPICVPGHQVSCTCPAGGQGAQICQPDGMGFGDCLGCAGMAGPCSPTMGQSDPSYQWDQAFTFPSSTLGIREIALGPSGEVVLVGAISSFGPAVDFGGQTYGAADGEDAFVARYASDGTLSSVLGIDVGTGTAEATAAAVTPAGDIWVAGCYGGNLATAPDVGMGPMAAPPAMFLLRLDSAGNVVASDAYSLSPQPAPSGCFVQDIVVGASGRVAVTASYYGTVDFGTGPISSPTNNDSGSFLAAFDGAGANVYARTFGSAGGDGLAGMSVAMNASDEVLLAGSFFNVVDLGLGTLTAVDTIDLVLAGFGPTGTTTFATAYDGTGPMDALSFGRPAADGTNFVVPGSYEAVAPPDFGGGTLASGTGTNMFELTVAANGSWIADVVTPNAGASDVVVDGQGNRLLRGGLSQATDLGPCSYGAPSNDMFIARRSSGGTLDWVRTFTPPPVASRFAVGPGGEVLASFFSLSGTTITTDLGGGSLMGNHFLVKLDPTLP